MKNIALTALLALAPTAAAPATAIGSMQPLPAYVLLDVIPASNGQTSGYVYGLPGQTHGCSVFSGRPAVEYALADNGHDGGRPTDNTEWVAMQVYGCWSKAGLVPADVDSLHHGAPLAEAWARRQMETCGYSLAPVGLPDQRPSRCTWPVRP